MGDLKSAEDRDLELLRISQQLDNVKPGAVLPRDSYGTWIANPARAVEIVSPYANSQEDYITLKRDLCTRRASSGVYHAARHCLQLRIEKLTDLEARHTGLTFSDRVCRGLGDAGGYRRKLLGEARQAYGWGTSIEYLNAARERSERWYEANKRGRRQEHPFAEFDAAVVELLRQVIKDESRAREQRRKLFESIDKGHNPNARTIQDALQVEIDLNDVRDITCYLSYASFFGALNACDIYMQCGEVRNALEVLAFLGKVNLGVAEPTLLHAFVFLCFMQRFEQWIPGSGKIDDLDCEVVNAVSGEFALEQHYPALADLCEARLKAKVHGTKGVIPERRYWAMI